MYDMQLSLLPFTQGCLPFTASVIHKALCLALHSHVGRMNADAALHTWAHAYIAFGRFSESVHAALKTVVLNMESCELKTATEANQHRSVFAKSSISSCLIQTTLLFITHTCCTRDTESTPAHNKHSWGNIIPLSIYIKSWLVSMQIKLIPYSIGNLTGTVWNEATASRPDGRRGAIIIAGCGTMNLLLPQLQRQRAWHYLPLMSSWIVPVASFIDIAQPTMKHISYSFHMGRQQRGGGLLVPPRNMCRLP